MNLYILLFIAFLFQDPISTNVILLQAYQTHHNLWIIHLLFIIATLFDAIILYYLGKILNEKYSQNKIIVRIKQKTESFIQFTGKHSKKIALLVYGPIIFPLSAFIAPWIGISFWESTIFLLIGDFIIWYGSEWIIVLGVKTFVSDPKLALYIIGIISIFISIVIRYARSKINAPRRMQ